MVTHPDTYVFNGTWYIPVKVTAYTESLKPAAGIPVSFGVFDCINNVCSAPNGQNKNTDSNGNAIFIYTIPWSDTQQGLVISVSSEGNEYHDSVSVLTQD